MDGWIATYVRAKAEIEKAKIEQNRQEYLKQCEDFWFPKFHDAISEAASKAERCCIVQLVGIPNVPLEKCGVVGVHHAIDAFVSQHKGLVSYKIQEGSSYKVEFYGWD